MAVRIHLFTLSDDGEWRWISNYDFFNIFYSQSSPITSSMKRIGSPNIAAQQMYGMRKAPVHQNMHSIQSVWMSSTSLISEEIVCSPLLPSVHFYHLFDTRLELSWWRINECVRAMKRWLLHSSSTLSSFDYLLHSHTRVRGISRCCPVQRRIRCTLECTEKEELISGLR